MKNFHVVQQGDSLSRIARQYGTSTTDLRKLNNLRDPNKLHIGQKIALRKEAVCGLEALFLDADRNPIKGLEYIFDFCGKSIKGGTTEDGRSRKVITDSPTDQIRILVKRFDGTLKEVAVVISGYRNKLVTLISPLLVIDAKLKPHPELKPGERPNPKERIKPTYGSHHPAKPTTDKKDLGPKTRQAATSDGRPVTVVEGDIPALDEFLDLFNGELMNEDDYAWAAKELGIEKASIKAFAKVESGGSKNSGFIDVDTRKRPKILYERHYFSMLTKHRYSAKYPDISLPTGYYVANSKYVVADDEYKKKRNVPLDVQYFRSLSNKDRKEVKDNAVTLEDMLKNGQATELKDKYLSGLSNYKRLSKAYQLDKTAALESCSWGAFQIMGSNWKQMGYSSAVEFTKAMSRSEKEQIRAFVLFLKKVKPAIVLALKEKDWAIAAKLYNGKDYKKNRYDEKLQAAYEKFKEEK